jgi:hypothetical protein
MVGKPSPTLGRRLPGILGMLKIWVGDELPVTQALWLPFCKLAHSSAGSVTGVRRKFILRLELSQ